MGKWSTLDIPDYTGKKAIITGANSGIGYEVALELAKHGCSIVMACRSLEKAHIAKQKILDLEPSACIEEELLDVSDLSSVSAFSEKFAATNTSLSLLVNNAGVVFLPYSKSKDGIENVFATNYLGHFALTSHLFPLLLADGNARILNVGSLYHKKGCLDIENLQQPEIGYQKGKAYADSKIACLMFSQELHRRTQAANLPIMSVAAHPGFSDTRILLAGPEKEGNQIKKFFMSMGNALIAQSAAKGAYPLLYAATAPNVTGGEYYGPDGFQEIKGKPKLAYALPQIYDEHLAQQLWEKSEELSGVSFDLKPASNLQYDNLTLIQEKPEKITLRMSK